MISIACLMPVYFKDNSDYFWQSVESILTQQIEGEFCITLIFCADGPIKPEHKVIIDAAVNDHRMKSIVLNLETSKGLAANLNNGLEYALLHKFDFIARMDADDISNVDRFAIQARFLHDHPLVHLVGSWVEEFCVDNGKTRIIRYPIDHETLFRFFKKRDPVAHPSVMFRRSFFDVVGLYDARLLKDQDTDLWCRAFKAGAIFSNVSLPLLKFRRNIDTIGRRRNFSRVFSYLQLRFKVNRTLGYGLDSYIFAIAYALIQIAPAKLTNLAYRFLR